MAALSEGTWQIYNEGNNNEGNNPPRYFVTLTQENVNDANEYFVNMQANNRNDIWKFGDRYDTNGDNVFPEATIEFTRDDPTDANSRITGMTVTPAYNGDGMFDNGVLNHGGRKRSKKVKRSKKRATRRRRSSKNKSRKMNRRKRY
jgi:hypothetical protein